MLLYRSGKIYSKDDFDVKKLAPFDFSSNCTYGVGGKAEGACYPENILQAEIAYRELKNSYKKVFIVGNGSNVLPSDNGFDGAVISTKRLSGIVRLSNNLIFCLAGTKLSRLLTYCRKRCLGGLEYLYGIPATVGGATYMNAGIAENAIGNNIVSVRFFNQKNVILDHKSCNFGYRHSTMRDINGIITGVTLRVESSNTLSIDQRIEYYKQRRAHLPKGKSCGCVFKNPEGQSAGRLIELAGLKGCCIGGARVSDEHCNFVINGGASAEDIKRLINHIKSVVYDKFGVFLQEEVVYIGDFYDTDC